MEIPMRRAGDGYTFSQSGAAERAHGYAGPDGTALKWDFNRMAFAHRLGFLLLQIGEAAFEDGQLIEYPGFFEDMQLVLFLAALSDDELAQVRRTPWNASKDMVQFIDRRGVAFGSEAFGEWQAAYVAIISDALLSEAEPVPEGDASGTAGKMAS